MGSNLPVFRLRRGLDISSSLTTQDSELEMRLLPYKFVFISSFGGFAIRDEVVQGDMVVCNVWRRLRPKLRNCVKALLELSILLGLLLMDRCAGVLEVGTSLALEREQSHHS